VTGRLQALRSTNQRRTTACNQPSDFTLTGQIVLEKQGRVACGGRRWSSYAGSRIGMGIPVASP
jgi:hypothetical protein